jgi:hypothetical protein
MLIYYFSFYSPPDQQNTTKTEKKTERAISVPKNVVSNPQTKETAEKRFVIFSRKVDSNFFV